MELGTGPSWAVMHWVFNQDWKHNWPELLPPAIPPDQLHTEKQIWSVLCGNIPNSHLTLQDPKTWPSTMCINPSEETCQKKCQSVGKLKAEGWKHETNQQNRVKAVQNPKHLQTSHLFSQLFQSLSLRIQGKERWEHLQPHSPRLCSHRKPSQTSLQDAFKAQEIPSLVLCILFSAKRKCLMPSLDFTTLVAVKSEWNILWPPTPQLKEQEPWNLLPLSPPAKPLLSPRCSFHTGAKYTETKICY